MKKDELQKIKGNYWIESSQKYVVFLGKKLWIFQPDGTLVACRRDIVNGYKAVFLPGDRFLMAYDKKAAYRMISLKDGTDIWSIPQIKMSSGLSRLSISPKGDFAYDSYFRRGNQYLISIELASGAMTTTLLSEGLRTTQDIICDENGCPCLLQAHHEEVAGTVVSQNGIRIQNPDDFDFGSAYHWRRKWQHDGLHTAQFFLDSIDTVMTNDFWVYDLAGGERYNLLENEPNKELIAQLRPSSLWLNEDKTYITIMCHAYNIVVDYAARKIVGIYAGCDIFTKGCIVGNMFWISGESGLRILPFPYLEEFIMPKKNLFLR